MSSAAGALSPIRARTAHCHMASRTWQLVKLTFPAWVTSAAIGIGDRPSRYYGDGHP